MPQATPRFTSDTLSFIQKATRQKRPDWLDRNREDYEKHLLLPLQHFAQHLKKSLAPIAVGYHFPQRGLGRLKRSAHRAEEYGALFKDYVSYTARRPSESRFDHNPSLFFMIDPNDDEGDEVLVAGGLYHPSSRQLRAIREAIADDASAFDKLFATQAFAARFPGGFSDERKATRPPRGFDPNHPRIDWLKLQGFFVWRSYKKKEYTSKDFPDLVAKDMTQILKLNELLELALQGRLPKAAPAKKRQGPGLLTILDEIEAPRRKMDF